MQLMGGKKFLHAIYINQPIIPLVFTCNHLKARVHGTLSTSEKFSIFYQLNLLNLISFQG